MSQSGIILLTSTGLSSNAVFDRFKEIVDSKHLKKAVIITTASLEKEKNQYSQLAFSQLASIGLKTVDFYDFESDGLKDLSSYDVIYVCGGNTFKLMKFSKEMGFSREIASLLKRGGVYVGVSAGSLIIGPSIKIANEVHPDKNEVGLTDFSGFNIADVIVFPHYSSNLENEIASFESKNKVKVERINNAQAMIIQNKKKALI